MPQPLNQHTGIAAAIMRDNIDTDQIIPSREMKTVSRDGLGEGLFAGWRYTEPGGREPVPDFVLNRTEQQGTSVLISGENFGCGSSREHAVWALAEYGIRVIIAKSFGEIFHGNCLRNGVLPIALPAERLSTLWPRLRRCNHFGRPREPARSHVRNCQTGAPHSKLASIPSGS